MKRALVFVLAAGLASPAVVSSEAGAARLGSVKLTRDGNRKLVSRSKSAAEARRVFEEVMARPDLVSSIEPEVGTPGELCAIGVIPGPDTSFNIRFGLFNVLISESIGFTTIDSFLALGGNSLIHESVFSVTAPSGGTANVEYPTVAAGKGPVVLSFTGFAPLGSTSFNTDPDTYDDPSFGATVKDMNRTVVELAYNSGRRCRGVFAFQGAPFNASVALIVQTSP